MVDTAILLLDEPLAALDTKLRKSICLELKHIQKRVGITFLHVTHNQEKAMTVADRIAVIADGELVEQGSARAIYERPRRRFAADFIGESTLLEATVRAVEGDHMMADVGGTELRVSACGHHVEPGQTVCLSVRSEFAHVETTGHPGNGTEGLPAPFVEYVYLGSNACFLLGAHPAGESHHDYRHLKRLERDYLRGRP